MQEKITLKVLEEGADISGVDTERVWSTRVEEGLYRIENIPFYASGFSFGDVVYVSDRTLAVLPGDIVEFSNYSTVLVLVMNPERQSEYIKFSERWGCSSESSMERKSFIMSVPADTNLKELIKDLEKITDKNDDGFVILTQRHYSNNEVFY